MAHCEPLKMCQVSPITLVASKNVQIRTVSEFDEIRRGRYILRDDSNGEIRLVIRDLKNIPDFDRNYHFTLFNKIRIFSGFYIYIYREREREGEIYGQI